MGTIRINGFQAPEGVFATIEVFDAEGNNGFGLPGTFSQIGYTGNDGDFFPYFVDFDVPITTNLVNLTLSASNGCVLTYQDVCQNNFPTPTPTDLPPCYAALVESLGGSGNVLNYTDCNGNSTTYTSTTEVNVYLCMPFQQIFDVNFSVDLSTGYDCYSIPDPITGINDWYLPNIPSPTPTPTSVTPTPTPTDVPYTYETITYNYSFPSTQANRTASISMGHYSPFFNQPFSVNVDGNVTNFTVSNLTFPNYTFPLTGTSGTIVLSALTTTPGVIDSIYLWRGINYNLNTGITGTTQELSKLSSQEIIENKVYIDGDIASFSANTNLQNITFYKGPFYGQISDLPPNIRSLRLTGINTVTGDLSDLPNSIQSLVIGGFATISGDTSSLIGKFNQSFGDLILQGYCNITGLMSNLPDITEIEINRVWPLGGIDIFGNPITGLIDLFPTGSTISGPLTLKSNQAFVKIYGNNTISGNINAVNNSNIISSIGGLEICGLNTISGNIHENIKYGGSFIIRGNNTIGGNFSLITNNYFDQNIATFDISQINNYQPIINLGFTAAAAQYKTKRPIETIVTTGNTINGNISRFATCVELTTVRIGGNNTATGDLGSLSPKSSNPFLSFQIVSNSNSVNTINTSLLSTTTPIFRYTPGTGPSLGTKRAAFTLNLKTNTNGFTSTEVNNLLNYIEQSYDGYTYSSEAFDWPFGGSLVSLTGTGNGAPSGTGITAKNTLITRGFDVETN